MIYMAIYIIYIYMSIYIIYIYIYIYIYGNEQLRIKSAGGRNQKSQTNRVCAPKLSPVFPPKAQLMCGDWVGALLLRGQLG